MQAVIYVVDSSDTERIGISREEFHAILAEDELKDALILVYANKQVRLPALRPSPFLIYPPKHICNLNNDIIATAWTYALL